MKHHFATYFDKNYLTKGLTMYNSLQSTMIDFVLYILCLDEFTYSFFSSRNYDNITLIRLDELEEAIKELNDAKANRNKIEYFFTLSPCLPLFLIKRFNMPHICTLDADILFLSSPSQIFKYLDDYSIIITPHKFSRETMDSEKYGKYNVSFQIFKNDEIGISCLESWKSNCLNWCFDYLDETNGRFADQKYLDTWVFDYPGKVKELTDCSCGIAPWNVNNYKFTFNRGSYFSNGEKIIFYHFHHFKIFNNFWSSNGFNLYRVNTQKGLDRLYLLYWHKLSLANRELKIKDEFIRDKKVDSIVLKILNEKSVYLNIANVKIFNVNSNKIPSFLIKIIYKIYA